MESPAQFEQKATGINSLPDDHSECEPPDPIPNSEVKPLSADGSVGLPHVRVGHRQALKSKRAIPHGVALFYFLGVDPCSARQVQRKYTAGNWQEAGQKIIYR